MKNVVFSALFLALIGTTLTFTSCEKSEDFVDTKLDTPQATHKQADQITMRTFNGVDCVAPELNCFPDVIIVGNNKENHVAQLDHAVSNGSTNIFFASASAISLFPYLKGSRELELLKSSNYTLIREANSNGVFYLAGRNGFDKTNPEFVLPIK